MKTIVVTGLATIAIFAGWNKQQQDLNQLRYTSQVEQNVLLSEQVGSVMDCMRNNAYSRELLGQCIDDWFEMNASSDY